MTQVQTMPATPELPADTLALSNGITATIVLNPVPKRGKDGKYQSYAEAGKEQPDVFLTFRQNGEIIASKKPWGLVINGERTHKITPNRTLTEDDLYKLDKEGWDILLGYGLFPTSFVG